MSQSPKPLNRRLRASIDAKFTIDLTDLGLQSLDDAFAGQAISQNCVPETVIAVPEPSVASYVPKSSEAGLSGTASPANHQVQQTTAIAKPEVMLSLSDKAASEIELSSDEPTELFTPALVQARTLQVELAEEDDVNTTRPTDKDHKALQATLFRSSTPTSTSTDTSQELQSSGCSVSTLPIVTSDSAASIAGGADETTISQLTPIKASPVAAHSLAARLKVASQSAAVNTTQKVPPASAHNSIITDLEDSGTSEFETDFVVDTTRTIMESETKEKRNQTRGALYNTTSESDSGAKPWKQQRARPKRVPRFKKKDGAMAPGIVADGTTEPKGTIATEEDLKFVAEPPIDADKPESSVSIEESAKIEQDEAQSSVLNFLVKAEIATQTELALEEHISPAEEADKEDDASPKEPTDDPETVIIVSEMPTTEDSDSKGDMSSNNAKSEAPDTVPSIIDGPVLEVDTGDQIHEVAMNETDNAVGDKAGAPADAPPAATESDVPDAVVDIPTQNNTSDSRDDPPTHDDGGGDDDVVVLEETTSAADEALVEEMSTDVVSDDALLGQVGEAETEGTTVTEDSTSDKLADDLSKENHVPEDLAAEGEHTEQLEIDGTDLAEEAVKDQTTAETFTEDVVVDSTVHEASAIQDVMEEDAASVDVVERASEPGLAEAATENATIDTTTVEPIQEEADANPDPFVEESAIIDESAIEGAAEQQSTVGDPTSTDTPVVEPEAEVPTVETKSKRSGTRRKEDLLAATEADTAATVTTHRRQKSNDKHKAAVWEREARSSTAHRGPVLEKSRGEGGLFESAIARQIRKTREERDARRETEEYKEKQKQRRETRERREAQEREARKKERAEMRKQENLKLATQTASDEKNKEEKQKKKKQLSREKDEKTRHQRHEQPDEATSTAEPTRTGGASRHRTRPSGGSNSQHSDADKIRPTLLERLTSAGESDTRGPLLKLNMSKAGGYDPQDIPRSRSNVTTTTIAADQNSSRSHRSKSEDLTEDPVDSTEAHQDQVQDQHRQRQRRKRQRETSQEYSTTVDEKNQTSPQPRTHRTKDRVSARTGHHESRGNGSNSSARRPTNSAHNDVLPGLKLFKTLKAALTSR